MGPGIMSGSNSYSTLTILVAPLAAFIYYLWKLNQALKATPPEVLALSPDRWTDRTIQETYERIQQSPISWTRYLPPKFDRRYIVTGGSGGVGGQIILQLLERGQSPESIRNVDFRSPARKDMQNGLVTEVPFVQADISSPSSTNAAFSAPWPGSVAKLPLTVFHVAAVIVPHERSMVLFERVKRVNIDGTENVIDASKASGADILIATSSSSVSLVPVQYWGLPRGQWPKNYVQAVDESDFDKPLKQHEKFFGNYAHAKAVAERLVCNSNKPGFRTGVIRPGNVIYGNSHNDQAVGAWLRLETIPTWTPNIAQNCVHIGNVSLGHLLFEAVLADNDEMPPCAGRPFLITDPGPASLFQDYYRLLQTVAVTPFKVFPVPPVFMLLLAYVVEWADALSRVPGFKWAKPAGDLAMLQPSIFTAATHVIILDTAAKRPVAQGGLGYKGVCTTMEGMCQQVLDWNREHGGQGHEVDTGLLATVIESGRNLASVPVVVKG